MKKADFQAALTFSTVTLVLTTINIYRLFGAGFAPARVLEDSQG